MKMTDPNGLPIAAIFYDGNRPFSVFASTGRYYSLWDFQHCERDGVICYHNSGGGPGFGYWNPQRNPYNKPPLDKLWLARGAKLEDGGKRRSEDRAPTNCARRLRRGGVNLIKTPIWFPGKTANPFEHWEAKEGDAEYCAVCQMFHDVTDSIDPCEHLEWCDDCCLWMGSGATDPCSHSIQNEIGDSRRAGSPNQLDG